MNDTIRTQLQHRTIREFEDKPVPEEILNQLIQVAARTATSNGMQACSVVRITDQAKKTNLQISAGRNMWQECLKYGYS
jgi:Nitroreductase family.